LGLSAMVYLRSRRLSRPGAPGKGTFQISMILLKNLTLWSAGTTPVLVVN